MKKRAAITIIVLSSVFSTSAYANVNVGNAMRDYMNSVNSTTQQETQNKPSDNQGSQKDIIKLVVDGVEIKTDVPPVIIDGRVLVPLRAMLESIGATINWNENTKTITSTKGSVSIVLNIGDSTAYVNDKQVALDVPAQIINNYTFVPARFIAETFNYNVNWVGNSTVEITSYNDVKEHPEIAAKNIPGVPDGWVPCDIGTLNSATMAIANGDVVYVNGQYWCSPNYANINGNENVVWVKDVSEGRPKQPIYNSFDYNSTVEPVHNEWSDLSILDSQRVNIGIERLMKNNGAATTVSDYDLLKYIIPSLPENFKNNPTTGVYEGINIKVEDGKILINVDDLKEKGIIS